MSTTTHERVTRLLPWLLNGTLDADERRQVEAHLAGCDACRAELEDTRAAFRLHATHLPPRALTAYAEDPRAESYGTDAGPAVDRTLVEAHLAHCPSCREELELVRASRAALLADDGEAAEDDEAHRGAAGSSVVAFRPAPPAAVPTAEAGGGPHRRWVLALAASLLVACVAAGGWFLTGQELQGTERRLAELERRLTAAPADGGADPAPLADGNAADGNGAAADTVTAAELEAARRRSDELARTVGELEQQVAGMERQVDRLRAGVTAPRPGPYVAPQPLESGEVLRGDGAAADEVVVSGDDLFNLAPSVPPGLLAGRDSVAYRLLDAAGREIHAGTIPVYDNEYGPYVSLFVPTAGLPAGPLTLVLSDGEGGEIARYGFRVEK